MQLPGKLSVNVFAGLESKADAMFRISHNYAGSDIDDFKLHIALVGGHQLQTKVIWRKESIVKFQSYLKWLTNYFQLPDTSAADILKIVDLTEMFLRHGIDTVFQRNIKINYEEIRNDLMATVRCIHTNLEGRENINIQLLTYITDSLENLISNR